MGKKILETTWVFIIDTDQYAGNFEREMGAFCTGQTGDCGVGEKEEEKFKAEMGEEKWEDMEELVKWIPDEHGCRRPVSIEYLTPGPGPSCNSVSIYFNDKPSQEIITMLKERAEKFTHGKERVFNKPRTMKITGFRMKCEERTCRDVEF